MAVRLLPGPFTVDAYHRLGQLGILDEDDRVELLHGQIVEMTPIGGGHAACVIRLNHLLTRRSASDTSVSVQNPVVLADRWEPLHPVALPRRRDRAAALPECDGCGGRGPGIASRPALHGLFTALNCTP